jgi:ABC-type transport system substrate-binding protein
MRHLITEPFFLARFDPLTYVATLRHGVLFHNGRELTSDDVVYTFRSLLDPAFRGRTGAYRQQLAAIVAKDRYTVEFKLTKPFGSFPINLVMGIESGSLFDLARVAQTVWADLLRFDNGSNMTVWSAWIARHRRCVCLWLLNRRTKL